MDVENFIRVGNIVEASVQSLKTSRRCLLKQVKGTN